MWKESTTKQLRLPLIPKLYHPRLAYVLLGNDSLQHEEIPCPHADLYKNPHKMESSMSEAPLISFSNTNSNVYFKEFSWLLVFSSCRKCKAEFLNN